MDGYHHHPIAPPPPPPFPPPLYPMPPPHASPPLPIDVSGGAITMTTATPVQFHYPPGPPVVIHPHPPLMPAPWSTGLCHCCDDVSNCCVTCFCPCITFGQIAEIVDQGSTSCGVSAALYLVLYCVTGCACLFSCFYRSKMRGQFFLEESPCADCLVHWCCEPCALCQEYRELRYRGFDLHQGWQGMRNGMMKPPAIEGMRR